MPKKIKELRRRFVAADFVYWDDLPVQMRFECIKRMDFMTRMQLRAASEQDKQLVESAPKYQFDKVEVVTDTNFLKISCQKKFMPEIGMCIQGLTPSFEKRAHRLLAQVFKFSTSKAFEFRTCSNRNNDFSDFLVEITASTGLHLEKIDLSCGKFDFIKHLLKRNKNVKMVKLNDQFQRYDRIIEQISLPAVIKASNVSISGVKDVEVPYQLIKKWIELQDLEVGKLLKIRFLHPDPNAIKFSKFADRIISGHPGSFLIATNDPLKAIRISSYRGETLTSTVIKLSQNEEGKAAKI